MQGYWEKYMKSVDSNPALVSFNASVWDDIPKTEFMYVGFIKVKLLSPSETGLVSSDEVDDIGFIEDRIELEALRYRQGEYIGRVISEGHVNFIYYLKLDFEWGDTAQNAMKHFENYTFEHGSRLDADWEVYQKLLFPTAKEWQIIQNHNACDALKESGDNLRLKRAIEHKMYFKTPEQRDRFSDFIKKQNFSIQRTTEPTKEIESHGLIFYRIDVPFYYDIDALTMTLIDYSQEFDGEYDGWETSLVKM